MGGAPVSSPSCSTKPIIVCLQALVWSVVRNAVATCIWPQPKIDPPEYLNTVSMDEQGKPHHVSVKQLCRVLAIAP